MDGLKRRGDVDPLDPDAEERIPGWVTTPQENAMQKALLRRVEARADREGIDRRRFLASAAGGVAALTIASRLAGKAKAQDLAADACAPPSTGTPFRATFTNIQQATQQEWIGVAMAQLAQEPALPQTIKTMFTKMKGLYAGFNTDQWHHGLMAGTQARRANAADHMVLTSLLHDLGKVISIEGHPDIVAAMLKPYVPEEAYHVVRTHQDFQGKHYYLFLGRSPTLRDKYRSEPWFALAEQFTDQWDQTAFDPAYAVDTFESFHPLIDQFFANPVWKPPAVC
jgi:predicted HD phosphohydrolase